MSSIENRVPMELGLFGIDAESLLERRCLRRSTGFDAMETFNNPSENRLSRKRTARKAPAGQGTSGNYLISGTQVLTGCLGLRATPVVTKFSVPSVRF